MPINNAKKSTSTADKQKLGNISVNKSQNEAMKQNPINVQTKTENITGSTNPQSQQYQQQKNIRVSDFEQSEVARRLSELKNAEEKTANFKSTKQLENIANQIESQIKHRKIDVADKMSNIDDFLKKKQKAQEVQNVMSQEKFIELKHQYLMKKKIEIKNQLQVLKYEDHQLKKHSFNKSVAARYSKTPQLSKDDREKWIKLRAEVKYNQQQSKKRMLKHEEKMKKVRQEQLDLIKRSQMQMSLEKKKILEAKISEIQLRTKQRSGQMQKERQQIARLKKKKKLYEKMQEVYIKENNSMNEQIQAQLMGSYLKKRQCNMRQIDKHTQKHDERIKQEEERRGNSRIINNSSLSNLNIHKSRFMHNVLDQDAKNKLLQQKKIEQIKALIDKRREYSTQVQGKYRPNPIISVKNRGNNTDSSSLLDQANKHTRSVSALQMNKQGNEYMRSINSSLAHLKDRPLKIQVKTPEAQKPRYKNYMSQLKMSRTQGQPQQREIQQINNILKKPILARQDKLYQAQMIADRMERRGSAKGMLKSINAKMQILKRMNNNDEGQHQQ